MDILRVKILINLLLCTLARVFAFDTLLGASWGKIHMYLGEVHRQGNDAILLLIN
jgi:hypothetical protein